MLFNTILIKNFYLDFYFIIKLFKNFYPKLFIYFYYKYLIKFDYIK